MVMLMEDEFVVRPRKSYGKSTVVSARLPDDLLNELNTVCTKTGRSRNELITMCIEYALQRIKIVDENNHP